MFVTESISNSVFRCAGCGGHHTPSEVIRHQGYISKRCPHCHSISADPLPSVETIQEFYDEYAGRYTAGMWADRYRTEMPKREAAKLRLVGRFCPSGSLLDLGSAHGLFGAIGHESGYRVSLGDYVPGPQDLGFALVVPVDLNRPNGVPYGDNSFDVVTFMSCIEHVMYPDVAVAELARLAKPGGYVAMDTPLAGDWCERNFAHHSHWIGPPEHLNLFSGSGLRRLAERAGLEVVYHTNSFERNLPRWLARKGRNVAVALHGVASRAFNAKAWRERRSDGELLATQAGDIQMIIARKPPG